MKRILNPWLGKDHGRCFGCGPENPIGMRLEFFLEEDGSVMTRFTPPLDFQSWHGMLHGGLSATLLDETCGWTALWHTQTACLTISLTTRYHRPVPVNGSSVLIRGHIGEMGKHSCHVMGEILDTQGQVLVSCEAVYYLLDRQKALEMGFSGFETEDIDSMP